MKKNDKLKMIKYIYEKTFDIEINDVDVLKKYMGRLLSITSR
jgi:hypothetical protein